MVLTRCMSWPGKRAMCRLKRVVRYLTGTSNIVVKVEHLSAGLDGAILTKGLGPMKFVRGRDMLGID